MATAMPMIVPEGSLALITDVDDARYEVGRDEFEDYSVYIKNHILEWSFADIIDNLSVAKAEDHKILYYIMYLWSCTFRLPENRYYHPPVRHSG